MTIYYQRDKVTDQTGYIKLQDKGLIKVLSEKPIKSFDQYEMAVWTQCLWEVNNYRSIQKDHLVLETVGLVDEYTSHYQGHSEYYPLLLRLLKHCHKNGVHSNLFIIPFKALFNLQFDVDDIKQTVCSAVTKHVLKRPTPRFAHFYLGGDQYEYTKRFQLSEKTENDQVRQLHLFRAFVFYHFNAVNLTKNVLERL